MLALAENFAPPVPALVSSGNGQVVETIQKVAAIEEVTPVLAPETVESVVRPLIESTEAAAPASLAEALELQASLVLESIVLQNEAKTSAVREIVESFQQQGKTALLEAPAQVVAAPAPPSLQWIRAPRPRILPCAPTKTSRADMMTGPQTPPLAGPCVPQELRNLVEQPGAGGRSTTRRKTGLPAWTVSLLVATTVFLGVGSVLQYLASSRDAKAASVSTQQSDQSSSGVSTIELPSSRLVEVTGMRVVGGSSNQKAQLHYIVVNHAPTSLSGISLKVAVRSGSSGSGSPLFNFTTAIASLGPYQSKEFRTDLDPALRASELPDWQDLRAEVRVGLQP